MANKRKPAVPEELLDQLLDGTDALEAFQSGDLVQDLKKALAERILSAELDHHLDHEEEQASGNHRNGHSRKRVLTDDGRLDLSIPRDRQGRFDPKLVEKHWRRQREQVTPFFVFSAPIRRAVYTNNAVESLNSTVRRAVRSKDHFPHDDAARKLIYLALGSVAAKWRMPPQFWWQVKGEFAIRFEERFTMAKERARSS